MRFDFSKKSMSTTLWNGGSITYFLYCMFLRWQIFCFCHSKIQTMASIYMFCHGKFSVFAMVENKPWQVLKLAFMANLLLLARQLFVDGKLFNIFAHGKSLCFSLKNRLWQILKLAHGNSFTVSMSTFVHHKLVKFVAVANLLCSFLYVRPQTPAS